MQTYNVRSICEDSMMNFSAVANSASIGDFKTELRHVLDRYRLSAYRLSEDSGVDRANLSRLLNGKSHFPTRMTVMQLCYGLARHGVLQVELDRILMAAGYAPQFQQWQTAAQATATRR
jgi:hypothetical protein